ncbi:unnamed protein product, partial [Didymodactylos carnosus]
AGEKARENQQLANNITPFSLQSLKLRYLSPSHSNSNHNDNNNGDNNIDMNDQ